jgi:hypothetical protein
MHPMSVVNILFGLFFAASPQQLVDVALPAVRLDVRVDHQRGCVESPSSPFFIDAVNVTARVTNISERAISFFEGEQASARTFRGMPQYRAGTPLSDSTESFYPEGIQEGDRYVIAPGKSRESRVVIPLMIGRPGSAWSIEPGPTVLQVQLRRRRLSDPSEVARSGETRTWVYILSQPLIFDAIAYGGSEACEE